MSFITVKCVKCGYQALKEEWDEATINLFEEYEKEYITKLFEKRWESCVYTCPNCGVHILGKDFLKEGK